MSNRPNAYVQRINLVLDYIRGHLTGDLSVNRLARVAGFSPFHFHRLFKGLTGETVNACVNRLRLERAVALLRGTELSITQVALECGFVSGSGFSRAFRRRFGLTARGWDRQSPLKESKNGQVLEGLSRYTREQLDALRTHDRFRVTVRTLPEQCLAYVRVFNAHRRPGAIPAAYEHLLEWARRRGLDPLTRTLYGMSQDDPDVTPLHLCRFDWALAVPAGLKPEGEVGLQTLPECRVAVIHIHGDVMQEYRALQYLFLSWLPRSRYQPANLPTMEIYRRQPAILGWETYDLECAVPITDL
jgi:AraC family transcriptional regulator